MSNTLNTSNTQLIVIIAVVALALYVYYKSYYSDNYSESVSNVPEYFGPMGSSRELNKFYEEPTAGVKHDLVDTMMCSKSCCGDASMPSFDGLTSEEFQRNISEMQNNAGGPYVRTNYTCANGPGGVGCPCIDKQSYNFLTNHGSNSHSIQEIEPTFLLGADLGKQRFFDLTDQDAPYTPYEVIQTSKSMFSNSPKLNDLELGRTPNPIDNVRSFRG